MLKSFLLTVLTTVALFLSCAPGPPISDFALSQPLISPNGDGVDDSVELSYTLSRAAQVTISFVSSDGRLYPFRINEPRSPGTYVARFYGTYAPNPALPNLRVLPNGKYQARAEAVDERGNKQAKEGTLTVVDADTLPPEIVEVALNPPAISPNGDSVDDEMEVSYRLTKEAAVSLYVADAEGTRYVLEGEASKKAVFQSHRWNGTSGGKLVPDGPYTLHIEARDTAGNRTDYSAPVVMAGGGIPKLDILSVRFEPAALPVGGWLQVEIKVKNTGTTTLRSLGPDPGTHYTTETNYNSFMGKDGVPLYFERAGFWRVGVSWHLADRPYPVRWGLGKDLAPGEEATITGSIQVLIDRTREVRLWTATIQEGIGFGGQVGLKTIIVSY